MLGFRGFGGSGLRIQGFEFRGLGFRVQGDTYLGFRVQDLGFSWAVSS